MFFNVISRACKSSLPKMWHEGESCMEKLPRSNELFNLFNSLPRSSELNKTAFYFRQVIKQFLFKKKNLTIHLL